ncbi:hypothetical protein L6164_013209 [Bauhinia variegata]|uniref:Uncharacterized protein n=1 Tax=Bauhinia variegata TaxID=167791 RepID=A0ACB9PCR4_BAUVA|nr:hypothetical protein L6164_013209 [Bauhinia variegata]
MWFGDMIDVKEFLVGGQDLYIRLAASELVNHKEAEFGHKKKLTIIVATTISAIFWMLLLGSYYIYRVQRNMTVDQNNDDEDMDLPVLFDLSTIAIATDNFSNMNKIGEGGFGPVYKGRLAYGQEVARFLSSKCSKSDWSCMEAVER